MRKSSARRAVPAMACAFAVVLIVGCAEATRAAPEPAVETTVRVVASTDVYGDVAERIGGDRVDVVSIIEDPAQDPHSYEANTQNQLALSKADVVIRNGGGYDDFIGRMLRAADNSSAEVVDAVQISGKAPKDGGEFNEHVWYDFPTMGKLADRIAAALASAAPDEGDAFQQNASAFKEELTPLEAEAAAIKATHAGSPVAVTEPVPMYLVQASGLINRTPPDFSEAVEEGDDVSPRALKDTLALFDGGQVEALVYNEQTESPQTERVRTTAETAGVPVVPVTETLPRGETYVSWMTDNIEALQGALDT